VWIFGGKSEGKEVIASGIEISDRKNVRDI